MHICLFVVHFHTSALLRDGRGSLCGAFRHFKACDQGQANLFPCYLICKKGIGATVTMGQKMDHENSGIVVMYAGNTLIIICCQKYLFLLNIHYV
jgi:hypothetical protein